MRGPRGQAAERRVADIGDDARVVTSLFGMVVALALWLAFFPPAAYRRRFEAAAGAAESI